MISRPHAFQAERSGFLTSVKTRERCAASRDFQRRYHMQRQVPRIKRDNSIYYQETRSNTVRGAVFVRIEVFRLLCAELPCGNSALNRAKARCDLSEQYR